VPEAQAAYSELGTYYYTSDHIGRPFNLRDGGTLTWYEQHYPFGEVIDESVEQTMTAGAGDYAVSWKPNFRFPGQYEDTDMGTAANSRPLFVQNHYREYMPRFGRYNRVDPEKDIDLFNNGPLSLKYIIYTKIFYSDHELSPYLYAINNPFGIIDPYGLSSCVVEKSYYNMSVDCSVCKSQVARFWRVKICFCIAKGWNILGKDLTRYFIYDSTCHDEVWKDECIGYPYDYVPT
jgi:RHS repeat-associated protein